MSIATEIQRLQTAKADIKNAIEEKGVEVGDGLIDTYAEKIAEISGGSGDVVDLARYASVVRFGSSDWAKEETTITLERAKTLEYFWYGFKDTVVKHLIVNCLTPITTMLRAFYLSIDSSPYAPNSIEHITINADTSLCTTYQQTFVNMRNLKIIDGIPLDLSSASASNIFSGVPNVEKISFAKETIKINLSVSGLSKLSVESLLSILYGLYNYGEDTSGTTHTLTLGATNLAKLTDEQKAIATEKGWSLV